MPHDAARLAISNRAWVGKLALPLVAVAMAFATFWFGNQLVPALREGVAVFLFLTVIMGNEVVAILNKPKEDGKPDDNAALGAAAVAVLTILYAGVVWVGVLAAEPNSGFVDVFYGIMVTGTIVGIGMIEAHRRLNTRDPRKAQKDNDVEAKTLAEKAAKLSKGADGTEL
jgi:hypothetical protein